MNRKLLLVDDEPQIIAALQRTLIDEPYEIITAGSGEEGLAAMERHRPAVVLSDERMPGMGGAEFFAEVRNRYPETVRLMLTGHASLEATMHAVNRGEIYRFFTKPWDNLELQLALRSAFEKHALEEENRRLLRTVRRQSRELKMLEEKYPGITVAERDDAGVFVLPDLSDEELVAAIERCNRG